MNRFSSDIDSIDSKIPENLFAVYQTVIYVFAALIAIAVVKPWFLVIVPVVLLTQWAIQVSWCVCLCMFGHLSMCCVHGLDQKDIKKKLK